MSRFSTTFAKYDKKWEQNVPICEKLVVNVAKKVNLILSPIQRNNIVFSERKEKKTTLWIFIRQIFLEYLTSCKPLMILQWLVQLNHRNPKKKDKKMSNRCYKCLSKLSYVKHAQLSLIIKFRLLFQIY